MEKDRMRPKPMKAVFDGCLYEVSGKDDPNLIASDTYYDGKNFERKGRNKFLFKTLNKRYFMQHRTTNPNEEDYLKPLTQDEAITMYLNLKDLWPKEQKEERDKEFARFREAFPDVGSLDKLKKA